jgi:hypothetical protein
MLKRTLLGLLLASTIATLGGGCDSSAHCIDQCSERFPTDAAARSHCQLDCADKTPDAPAAPAPGR